jgi:hypothetical protein
VSGIPKTARVVLKAFEQNASNLEELEPKLRDLLLVLADDPLLLVQQVHDPGAGDHPHTRARVCQPAPSALSAPSVNRYTVQPSCGEAPSAL